MHKLSIWSFVFLLSPPLFCFEHSSQEVLYISLAQIHSGCTAFCCCKGRKDRRLGSHELNSNRFFFVNLFISGKDHAEHFPASNLIPDTRWENILSAYQTKLYSLLSNHFLVLLKIHFYHLICSKCIVTPKLSLWLLTALIIFNSELVLWCEVWLVH